MLAVCDQCGRVDLAANTDAVDGDELVADEADHACSGNEAEVLDVLGIGQTPDGLPPGEDSRKSDHQDDEQAGEILGAPVSVGVGPRGQASSEDERDPQRYGRERV